MQFPTENVNLATSLIEEAKLPPNEKEKEFIQKSCDESSDRFL